MAKTIFEQTSGTCTMQGDYCLPNLTLPPEEERPIRRTPHRRVGASPQAVPEAAPQNPVLQSAHFRQAPLPPR